jgi:hypothetical protein
MVPGASGRLERLRHRPADRESAAQRAHLDPDLSRPVVQRKRSACVLDLELEITKGGNAEVELAWALAYADRIDPLSTWRQDIAKVNAKLVGEPCPECGKVHDVDGTEPPPAASPPAKADADGDETADGPAY